MDTPNISQLLTKASQQVEETATVLSVIDPLTKREIEVMRLLLDPSTRQTSVAGLLNIEKKTLDHHLSHIYDKLGGDDLRSAVQRFVLFYPQYLGEMLSYYINSPAAQN